MTAYDLRARTQAARALNTVARGGKGQAVTLTPAAYGSYNPAAGSAATTSPTAQTGSGVEVDYKAREIDGEIVKAGDKKFLLSPLKDDGTALTAPSVGDLVSYGGKTWRIQTVETLAPAGTAVMFTLQLRGVG